MKLKPVDRDIINLVQDEDLCVPRITRIAHALHLPTSTVQARLNKLTKEGVIKGCTILVDPEKVGRGFTAFILGQVKLGEGVDLEEPIPRLLKIPQVLEVFYITGDYDYLIKIRVKDQDEYYKIVQEVSKNFNVRGKGIIAPKCFKDSPKLVVE